MIKSVNFMVLDQISWIQSSNVNRNITQNFCDKGALLFDRQAGGKSGKSI